MTYQTNAIGTVTAYGYCECGALDPITAALGVSGVQAQTTFGYDLQGRRTLELFADGTALNHSYDLPGRLLVTSHSVPNDTHTYFNTTNTYDNAGRLITASNYYGQLQLQALVYDALDRVCTNIDANGVAVVTAYDSLGRPTQRAYPDNGSEYFGYSFNVPAPPATPTRSPTCSSTPTIRPGARPARPPSA